MELVGRLKRHAFKDLRTHLPCLAHEVLVDALGALLEGLLLLLLEQVGQVDLAELQQHVNDALAHLDTRSKVLILPQESLKPSHACPREVKSRA